MSCPESDNREVGTGPKTSTGSSAGFKTQTLSPQDGSVQVFLGILNAVVNPNFDIHERSHLIRSIARQNKLKEGQYQDIAEHAFALLSSGSTGLTFEKKLVKGIVFLRPENFAQKLVDFVIKKFPPYRDRTETGDESEARKAICLFTIKYLGGKTDYKNPRKSEILLETQCARVNTTKIAAELARLLWPVENISLPEEPALAVVKYITPFVNSKSPHPYILKAIFGRALNQYARGESTDICRRLIKDFSKPDQISAYCQIAMSKELVEEVRAEAIREVGDLKWKKHPEFETLYKSLLDLAVTESETRIVRQAAVDLIRNTEVGGDLARYKQDKLNRAIRATGPAKLSPITGFSE